MPNPTSDRRRQDAQAFLSGLASLRFDNPGSIKALVADLLDELQAQDRLLLDVTNYCERRAAELEDDPRKTTAAFAGPFREVLDKLAGRKTFIEALMEEEG